VNAPAPPSLDLPYYGISFGGAIKRAFQKYANFKGRASRSEYWWWALFVSIIYLALAVPAFILGIQTSTDGGRTPGPAGVPFLVVFSVFLLAVILPSLALLVRRLHDVGFSGWFALLNLVPWVGGLVTTILALLPSSANGLRFDPFPPGTYPPLLPAGVPLPAPAAYPPAYVGYPPEGYPPGQQGNPPPYQQYPPSS
jgi:uncharacterized membrane protein YhaH (DUF805 family)